LAQETLDVKTDTPLPRGSALIIGGDLVYPDATRENYWERMRQPYMLAYPHDTRRSAKHPRLFAIPGNQLITAGGGGAFTHSTHTLKEAITIPDIRGKDTAAKTFTLANRKSASGQMEPSCYPSQSTSRRLMKRNLWFPLTNLDFSMGLGVFYWFISWFFTTHEGGSMFDKWVSEAQNRDQNILDYPATVLNTLGESPGLAILIGILFLALIGYADSKKLTSKLLLGSTHALLHTVCFLGLAIWLRILNTGMLGMDPSYFLTRMIFAGEMIVMSHYDVIVVGSGYGGGISASRMARCGKSVCVLERGKEFLPGEFPDRMGEGFANIQINNGNSRIGSERL